MHNTIESLPSTKRKKKAECTLAVVPEIAGEEASADRQRHLLASV